MKKSKRYILLAALVMFHGAVSTFVVANQKAQAANAIIFPIIGQASFSNDFNAPRGSGIHEAIDIIAAKGQKLVAAVDGTITRVNYPQPNWGYAIYIEDVHGYRYAYLHMNDDNPGTNDGAGGPMRAYTPDMREGNVVKKGQHIGWVGDSGNANGVSHLHFEMYNPSGNVVNPYESLQLARRLSTPLLYPALPGEILPYGRTYKSGFSLETGNLDGDVNSEYLVGSGPNLSTTVTVYDHNNTRLKIFAAYAASFKGGLHVGTADVDGNGVEEIITGAGGGGTPLVKTFAPDGTELGRFSAYTAGNKMGVLVAGADVDGDGNDEIVTSLGSGGPPLIRIFESDGTQLRQFYAYDENIRFGVDITAGNVSGNLADEIITSPLKGGVPKIRAFDGTTMSKVKEFYAYGQTFLGGVRVSSANVRSGLPGDEIVTVPYSKAGQHVKIFSGSGSYQTGDKLLEEWWIGYHDIAAGTDMSKTATGVNRRVSIRNGLN